MKHFIIIGAIILFVCVGISGCEEVRLGDKFSGTWVGSAVAQSSDFLPDYLTKVTFSGSNAYFTIEWGMSDASRQEITYSGTYDTEGDTLILINEVGGAYSFTYRFEKENGHDVLYLDNSKFTKQ